MVKAMKQSGLKTVVVIIAGRPMILDPIMGYADVIATAYLPGSEYAGVTDIPVRRCPSHRQAGA
jgi:beta-glucosidase